MIRGLFSPFYYNFFPVTLRKCASFQEAVNLSSKGLSCVQLKFTVTFLSFLDLFILHATRDDVTIFLREDFARSIVLFILNVQCL